jgi:hypothetical protein
MNDRNLAGVEVYWIEHGHSHQGLVVEILDDPLVRFLPHPLDDGSQEDAKVRVDLRATSAGCRQEASPSNSLSESQAGLGKGYEPCELDELNRRKTLKTTLARLGGDRYWRQGKGKFIHQRPPEGLVRLTEL